MWPYFDKSTSWLAFFFIVSYKKYGWPVNTPEKLARTSSQRWNVPTQSDVHTLMHTRTQPDWSERCSCMNRMTSYDLITEEVKPETQTCRDTTCREGLCRSQTDRVLHTTAVLHALIHTKCSIDTCLRLILRSKETILCCIFCLKFVLATHQFTHHVCQTGSEGFDVS